jgi:drug/metabolite transporter (DMT)-like permease
MIVTSSKRRPVLMLVLAALLWGMGFAWAKNVGAAVNAAAHLPEGAVLGPTITLAFRFGLSAILWIILFRSSHKGWTPATWGRGLILGATLGLGVILQHLGLDRSSEATIAFLTNLTIVFVPVIIAIILRKLPKLQLLCAIPFALAGIWLLTGAKASGLSTGEWLGVGCAVAFSFELVLMNWLIPKDSPMRLTVLMFAVTAAASFVLAALSPGFGQIDWRQLCTPGIVGQFVLLTLLTTLLAFGLMNIYQPQVDTTRAAIIYLFEPIFAAVFAWLVQGATMTPLALSGAGLILLANGIAEIRGKKVNAG